jgi:uncharacterized protein
LADIGFDLFGTQAVARCDRMLWLPKSRALIASDMHFEKGSAFAARGRMLPPFDTRETLDRLEQAIQALKPDVLIALGDSFHDRTAGARMDPHDRARLAALSEEVPCMWIEGNHDPEVPSWLSGQRGAEMRLETLTFRHEPTGREPGEVAGHLHPCAKVAGRGGRVRRACFVSDGTRLIMPSLGAFTGGLNVLDVAYQGLLSSDFVVLVPGRRVVHQIGRTRLICDGHS